jgi:DNA modification methylase
VPKITSPTDPEKLGYPTQKSEALLERILHASSAEGMTVLDPFCGCGTAVAVSQKLNREWIGIDITHLAINLVRHRLTSAFGADVKYKVIGEPVSLPDAEDLANSDPY